MGDDVRRRAACDRCHSQKIRCPKRPGQEVCDRCAKSGTTCVFRPFRQKKPIVDSTTETPLIVPRDWSSEATRITATATTTGTSERDTSLVRATKRKRLVSPVNEEGFDSNQTIQEPPLLQWDTIDPIPTTESGFEWMTNPFTNTEDFVSPNMLDDLNFDYSTLEFTSPILQLPSSSNSRTAPSNFTLESRQPPPQQPRSFPMLNADTSQPLIPSPLSYGTPLALHLYGALGIERVEQDNISGCIRKLSQLSINLYEHRNTLPPVSIHSTLPISKEDCEVVEALDYSNYSIEETFRLTQNLVELYPSFLHTCINRCLPPSTTPAAVENSSSSSNTTSPSSTTMPPSSSSQDHSSLSASSSPSKTTPSNPITDSEPTPKAKPLPPLDHSAILLIISCHIRLITIYEELFTHMEICINQNGITDSPKTSVQAPSLKIGDYTPPREVAVSMQLLMLMQFTAKLFSYSGELADKIKLWEGQKDAELSISIAAADNCRVRAGSMSTHLGIMRNKLMDWGMIC